MGWLERYWRRFFSGARVAWEAWLRAREAEASRWASEVEGKAEDAVGPEGSGAEGCGGSQGPPSLTELVSQRQEEAQYAAGGRGDAGADDEVRS